jgi:hypothetical protein
LGGSLSTLAHLGSNLWNLLKKAVITIGIFFLTIAVLLGAFVWWASVGVFSTSRFDKAEWLTHVPQEREITCYRGGMARDIKNRLLTPGMTKQEVEALLGPPDNNHKPQELEYTLGMCSGFRIDHDGLIIRFSTEGRLINAYIVQH